MREYLFNIAESFELSGQGLVLASDRKIHQIPQLLCVGHIVEFCPVGAPAFRAKVTSLQHMSPFSPYKPQGFSVESFVRKEQVPVGTPVWLVGDAAP